jgi:hypothetical protein
MHEFVGTDCKIDRPSIWTIFILCSIIVVGSRGVACDHRALIRQIQAAAAAWTSAAVGAPQTGTDSSDAMILERGPSVTGMWLNELSVNGQQAEPSGPWQRGLNETMDESNGNTTTLVELGGGSRWWPRLGFEVDRISKLENGRMSGASLESGDSDYGGTDSTVSSEPSGDNEELDATTESARSPSNLLPVHNRQGLVEEEHPAGNTHRAKRGLRSRPKLSRKIFRKITPTKVLVGGHIASYAYKQYQNWTGQANATTNTGLNQLAQPQNGTQTTPLPINSKQTATTKNATTNNNATVANTITTISSFNKLVISNSSANRTGLAGALNGIAATAAEQNATTGGAANSTSSLGQRSKQLVMGELDLHFAPAIG